ncbi:ribose-5-phosphate isomerase RpiA [Faunimonas sp. B44]|uniref:ribose-5-phosphate isomerase RpiA n=1 Tax=Faunimonas sp. B44 TaxID=3461493 RepID=UPI0040448ABD
MADDLKRRAAEAALAHVESGMRLGLGTGSTAAFFVKGLAERVSGGLDVVGVPTSEATAALARALGVPLATLEDYPELDLAVDGADEIGPGLSLVKGGGGALLREKIVAHAARRMIVIADASKVVDTLGAFPLPIEAVPFGLAATSLAVERCALELGLSCALDLRRRDGEVAKTDGGNWLLDASFGRIPEPEALARELSALPGVVEHGLFLGYADLAIIAGPDGLQEIAA